MIEQDSVKLLRECDAGVKMGVSSIDEVIGAAKARGMRDALVKCREEHQALGQEIRERLERFHDQGKDPSPVAQTMSRLKTQAKLLLHESDASIARLMVDGCEMGVQSLDRYLEQYKAADERSKDIAKRLIGQEKQLASELRAFL